LSYFDLKVKFDFKAYCPHCSLQFVTALPLANNAGSEHQKLVIEPWRLIREYKCQALLLLSSCDVIVFSVTNKIRETT